MVSDLRTLLNPRGAAFIGVSPDPMKYAGRAMAFLRAHGFRGPLVAVNPKYDEVLGVPCVGDASQLPAGQLDLAFIAVSADRVNSVIAECGRKGIGAAIVASSGFREAGAEGARREEELRKASRDAGVRICGPNCIGIANVLDGIVATFGTVFEGKVKPGKVGVISQSGAFASLLVDSLRRRDLGVSYMVSSGNEIDVTAGDYLSHMVADGRTRIILVYMEGIRDASCFLAAADQARLAGIPVVLLKTGKTEASRRAILSHTGNLAGDQEVETAAFERFGIITVSSIEEMTELAMLGTRLPGVFSSGRNVGVVCVGSGGATSLASDVLEGAGLAIPLISEAATVRLRAAMPPFVTPQNPLDVAGYSFSDEAQLAGVALETFGNDSSLDKLMAVVPGLPHIEQCLESINQVSHSSATPLLSVFIGGPYTDRGIELANAAELPWSNDLERAGRALAAAARFGEATIAGSIAPLLFPLSSAVLETRTLAEYEAKQVLSRYGLPVSNEQLCADLSEVLKAAREIGYPVALKIHSAALPHKSDVGGVALNISDETELRRTFNEMQQRLRRVLDQKAIGKYLVQEMAESGVEVFVGVKIDPTFGPTLLLGPGGILVETIRDIAIAPLPLKAADVERMISKTALDRLFAGVRGQSPINLPAVVDAVLSVCRFAIDHRASIVDVEVNPLIATPKRAVAVDALIVSGFTAPLLGASNAQCPLGARS